MAQQPSDRAADTAPLNDGAEELTASVHAPPVNNNLTRRSFLRRGASVAAGAVALSATGGALRLAFPNATSAGARRRPLGSPADFKSGTVTWLASDELFVLHQAEGFAAISARCTHLGCTVRRSATGFACPCHGALFDPFGRVLAGPARRPLVWLAVTLEADGALWVDPAREIENGVLAPLMTRWGPPVNGNEP